MRWLVIQLAPLAFVSALGCASGKGQPASNPAPTGDDIASGDSPRAPQLRPASPGYDPDAFWKTIGVVDMQAAVLSTEDGLRAQAELKVLFENRQRELDDRQRALATEQQAIQKLNPASDQAKRRAADWQAKANALQAAFQGFQTELKEREAALTAPIVQKMQRVLRDVAAQRRFKFVIEKQAVPLSPPENDLTAEVSRAYDAADPAKK